MYATISKSNKNLKTSIPWGKATREGNKRVDNSSVEYTNNNHTTVQTTLNRDGYIFIREWKPEKTTISIGSSIGFVVDIQALLDSSIPTVQTLHPRKKSDKHLNQYSGVFGLEEFPLHTDLAHWEVPPRYILLRCIEGSQTVQTKLLDSFKIFPKIDQKIIRHALVRPRRSGKDHFLTLLPIKFDIEDKSGIRWDSLFLVPMNEETKCLSSYLETKCKNIIETLILAKKGDTLIIDNWRILHGRSKVSKMDITRKIERIYLSGLKNEP